MSTPPPRISLSELWGHARIRDLLSITVKCKILKLSTKTMSGLFSGSPLPPPQKKKKILDPRMGDWLFMHWFPAWTSFKSNNSLYHKNVQITPINLELAAFQKHGGPRISFFRIVLTRSNFDHYTRECGFGILKNVVRPTSWRPQRVFFKRFDKWPFFIFIMSPCTKMSRGVQGILLYTYIK